MKVVPLKAERRTAIGRNQVATLRTKGWLPAVVYGAGGESVPIAISEWELDKHIRDHHKVFTLDVDGTAETALLQDVAWHTLTDRPLHADFKRIDLNKPIESTIEVTLIGYPVGLGKGGQLLRDSLVIPIRCLPAAMPEVLEQDISKLEVDDKITASQLAMPEGVELLCDPEMTVCRVVKASIKASDEEAETPEGEDGVEDGAGDGDATPAPEGSDS